MKLSKLYFNYFKNEGTVRLMFVLGCFFAFCEIWVCYTVGYPASEYLWTIFWFYLPFLICAPIKFIRDGYKKSSKKSK